MPTRRFPDTPYPQAPRFVLGLALTSDRRQVVLMLKNRPAWQAGRLNAPGGRIEPGEDAVTAMVREFAEETGVMTAPDDWCDFARLQGPDFDVCVFKAFSDAFRNVRAAEDQPVALYALDGEDFLGGRPISNIRWLVHAALDANTDARALLVARYEVDNAGLPGNRHH